MAAYRGATERKHANGIIPLVVVVGPTASGKSDLVNLLAKAFEGEVVNADSRQLYRDFSIGTNKEKGVWKNRRGARVFVVDGVPYHVIDFASPRTYFSVYTYQKIAKAAIEDIFLRGKQPFLSGGTGFYIDAVVDNWKLTKESYDKKLRSELSKKSNIELLRRLEKNDPETAKTIDVHNTTRLIRAVEIVELTGTPKGKAPKRGKPLYTTLKIGVYKDRDHLYKRIDRRTEEMFKAGLLEEVKELYKKYPKTVQVFYSIGYKELIPYLQGTVSLKEAKETIQKNTRRYAKRQMTWWRRDATIHWCASQKEAKKIVRTFLAQKASG